MKKQDSKIQVYCTVSKDELSKVGDEYYCQKCSHRLIDVDNLSDFQRRRLSRAGQLVCGFISALTLAGCSPTEGDVPLPGITMYTDGFDPENQEIPTAKRVEGQPHLVESPFGNGRLIDVSDHSPGDCLIDPYYPGGERKIFRVPE